jgi:beta-lactamase class A
VVLGLLAAAPAVRADLVVKPDELMYSAHADPISASMGTLQTLGTNAFPAPLWEFGDPVLQAAVDRSIDRLGLRPAVRRQRLAAALVDITNLYRPRVAQLNGDTMMYAASLPKIAVLLAAFEKERAGRLRIDRNLQAQLEAMIQYSSNSAATATMQAVGKDYIAEVLMSPRYRLYDPTRNGGLWCGKDYASSGVWRRDPLHNISHGATAMQVARFYYLLETGQLVSPDASRRMKAILARTEIPNKFAHGLRQSCPTARMYRKSGTWGAFNADSAIVEHDGRRYVAVALSEDPAGAEWLSRLIVAFDRSIFETAGSRHAQAIH